MLTFHSRSGGVRPSKLLDYSGSCERPFELPLRERLLWHTAHYVDVHGSFPDGEERFGRRRMDRYSAMQFREVDPDEQRRLAASGEALNLRAPMLPSTEWRNGAETGEALVVQAMLERVRLSCGACRWCAHRRKVRWERAASGWTEQAPLTLFGTFTFSDDWFCRGFNPWSVSQALTEQDAPRAQRYDPENDEHESFARAALMEERVKLFKRLRMTLKRRAEFEGVSLLAHLSLYEMGDLRGRLHMHFLLHVDPGDKPVDETYLLLREFLKEHWHRWGIGFVDVKKATATDSSETSRYLFQYMLKYQETGDGKRTVKARSRLAVSVGYRVQGTDKWFGARPAIVPGGLRPVDPVPEALRRGGVPASASGDADREDLELSALSQALSLAEMPDEFRRLAEKLAIANLAWRDGDLSPTWSSGKGRPEHDWAEIPPDEFEFANYILSLRENLYAINGPGRWARWIKVDRSIGDDPSPDYLAYKCQHPVTGQVIEEERWLSLTNTERAICVLGFVPVWWPFGRLPSVDPARVAAGRAVLARPLAEVVSEEVAAAPARDPVGPSSLSARALSARGLGPDTVISEDGTFRRHPDEDPDFIGPRAPIDMTQWRNSEGRLYLVDRLTGEILSEVDETEPPF